MFSYYLEGLYHGRTGAALWNVEQKMATHLQEGVVLHAVIRPGVCICRGPNRGWTLNILAALRLFVRRQLHGEYGIQLVQPAVIRQLWSRGFVNLGVQIGRRCMVGI